MTSPARAAFLTRDAATGAAGGDLHGREASDDRFIVHVTFDHAGRPQRRSAGDPARPAATGALTRTTSARGRVHVHVHPDPAAQARHHGIGSWSTASAMRPASMLDPITMALRTVVAPQVVRFRPRDGMTDVVRDAAISVRFTESMDRTTTKAAFSVTADGKPVAGRVTFAENDTVLVFDPSSNLPYGAKVVATVAATAKSADGVPLGCRDQGTFTVVPKADPAKPARRRATLDRDPRSPSSGGGGSVGGGSWGAVERYYLGLMNCTRTGGWVTSGGDCSSPGGRSVAAAPARLPGSARRSRGRTPRSSPSTTCAPTSAAATRATACVRAGYTSYRWAENLGCRSGQPVQRGPRHPPLLPEREAVQRRPLREPDERRVRPRRASASGCPAVASGSSSTSTTA